MAAQYVKLDPADEPAVMANAAQVLRTGGVVIAPTETLYGLLSRADHDEAVGKLRQIRGGPPRAMTLHIGKTEQALPFIDPPAPYVQRIMRSLWPGPVSLVMRVSAPIREACVKRGIQGADLYDGDSITLRCPAHPLTRRILESCEHPIVGAASPHAPTRVDDVPEHIRRDVELILDGGTTVLAKPSTIIRVHQDHFDIVRPGVYDRRIIEKMLQTTILFVCSGNTCRSPMAEAIARKAIADSLKLPESEIGMAGYSVVSAGASAMSGAPAASNAVEAVRALGADLTHHRSRPLTRQLIDQATAIFAMSRSHMEIIRMINPLAADKTVLLDPEGDIEDPIGGDLGLYKTLAQRIKALIERRLADKTLLHLEK